MCEQLWNQQRCLIGAKFFFSLVSNFRSLDDSTLALRKQSWPSFFFYKTALTSEFCFSWSQLVKEESRSNNFRLLPPPTHFSTYKEKKMDLNSTYVSPSQPLRNKSNVLNVSRNSNNITKAKAHVPSKAAQRRAEKRLAEQLLQNHLKDLISYQVTL